MALLFFSGLFLLWKQFNVQHCVLSSNYRGFEFQSVADEELRLYHTEAIQELFNEIFMATEGVTRRTN